MKNKAIKISLIVLIILILTVIISTLILYNTKDSEKLQAKTTSTEISLNDSPKASKSISHSKAYNSVKVGDHVWFNQFPLLNSQIPYRPDLGYTYCIHPGGWVPYPVPGYNYYCSGEYSLPIAGAFIIADQTMWKSSGREWLEKQQGIWGIYSKNIDNQYDQGASIDPTIGRLEIGAKNHEYPRYSVYDSWGVEYFTIYTEYHKKMEQEGFYTKDNTDINKINMQRNNNKYTIGPFNISYYEVDKRLKEKFPDIAGIESVKLIGYKNESDAKNKVNGQEIAIEAIKVGGTTIQKTNIKSGQDFFVDFNAPTNKKIGCVQLEITFKYKLAFGEYKKLVGDSQTLMLPEARFEERTTELVLNPVRLTPPSLGGNVWEDGLGSKENVADGINKTANDIPLKNVKVTLYDSKGNIASLETELTEEAIAESGENREDYIMHRVNPTYTDSNGDYLFEGIDASEKYTVVFEYNGQKYLPTKKITPEAENTSIGLEKAGERTSFNNKFGEVRSYPENYKTSNSLGKNLGTYNRTYTQYELMGYTLDENGKYQKTGIQLIDEYSYDENGNQTNTYVQGEISTKIIEYIYKNKKSPNIQEIYSSIAGDNTEIWRKLQYIEDYKIKSYVTVEDNTDKDHINQGLWRRQETTLILTKDVLYGATKINGKTELYRYNNRDQKSDEWEIQTRMQNYAQYYAGAYVNGIYKTDYEFEGAKTNGGSDLEVYITYKITVRNASKGVLAQIPEIVDYYDKNYTFVKDLSWVMYGNRDELRLKEESYFNMIEKSSLKQIPNAKDVDSSESSKYGKNTQKDISDETNKVYIGGLKDKKINVGEQAYIYLTFKVNKESNHIILGNYSNYAEINGYQTFYAKGTELPNSNKITNDTTVAGIVDKKSTPGNLTSETLKGEKPEKNFENDTDRAVRINVEVAANDRNLNGYVWEDSRNKVVNNAIIGDGIRTDSEKTIAGVTVQLIEELSNGKEYLWKTALTDEKGRYEFNGIVPGDYRVRFIYGNRTDTVLPTYKEQGVSYNGQDYKSTVYQKDMIDDKNLEKEEYDIATIEGYGKNLSDAKDLWEDKTVIIKQANGVEDQTIKLQGRQTVNNYSTVLTNEKAEILASPYKENIVAADIEKLVEYTQMVAETAKINLEIEKNTTKSDGKSIEVGNEKRNTQVGNYRLDNIDFGLTERPKAQLELDKNVDHIRVVLANQNVLFDTKNATTNLIWQKASKYNIDSNIKNYKYTYSYKDNVLKKINRYDGQNNGIIQLTMDEEIMHGATIQITYKLSVKNCSETDYTGKDFYYKGTVTDESKLVTTTATQLIDYVSNNLQYRQEGNNGWAAIKGTDLIEKGIVNKGLAGSVEQFNVVLQNVDFAVTPLEPGKEIEDTMILTQIITPQNEKDDLIYDNIAEIAQVTNTVGRRLAFSIVGNQDPLLKAQEANSSNSEQVIILPPFGSGYLYIGLGVLVAAIISVGVVLIKKKVLKK